MSIHNPINKLDIIASSGSYFSGLNLYKDFDTLVSGSLINISGSNSPKNPFYQLSIDNDDVVFTRTVSGSGNTKNLLRGNITGDTTKFGIGFQTSSFLQKSFEVRTATGSEPASIVLRTNEDGVVQIGEETGRIIFARESASFHPELDEFVTSGSTAEIFSRVTGINGGVPFGSLVFQTNTDAALVSQEVMEIGPGKGSTQATAPGVGISGSLKIINANPIFELQEISGKTIPIEIRTKSTDNDQGIIKVRDAGNTTVSIGDDSTGGYHLISGSGAIFASLSLDSSSFKTVMYDTASGKFFFTGSYGGGGGGSTPTFQEVTDAGASTTNNIDIDGVLSLGGFSDVSASLAAAVAGGDNLGNHTATEDLNLNSKSIKNIANITASGNISASGNSHTIGGALAGMTSVTAILGSFQGGSAGSNSLIVSNNAVFTGNITSSGIISASGNLIVGGTTTLNGNTILGNITSSGEISASKVLTQDIVLGSMGSIFIKDIAGNTDDTAIVNASDVGIIFGDSDMPSEIDATTITLDASDNIILSADNGEIDFKDGGNTTISFNTTTGHITASGAISGSSMLFASLSLDSSKFKTVMYDTSSGKFFFTGSYGGGGGSDTTPTLQEVTDEGATTTNGSLFLQNQTLDYGFSNGQNATSGFRSDGTNAFTHVTPQRFERRFFILGIPSDSTQGGGPAPFPNNHIVFDKPLVYQGFPNNGGGGPQDDGPVRPQIQGEVDIVLLTPKTTAGTGSKDPKGGILITPGSSDPGIYFFKSDASGSISGSHLIDSASAQIRFSTGSNAIKFFAGSTDETLKEVLHISKSGDNPRIGIGTSTPLRAFDFKEVRDDNRGGEILIRGSRTTKGAENNDEVGRINFAIDSASFGKIDTSGSAAEIVAIVDDIDATGVRGSLSLRIAAAKTDESVERIKLDQSGIHLTGSATFDTDVTIGDDLTVSDFALLNSARIGSTAIDPGDGVLHVEDYGVFVGGLKVGSSEDPGANNLIVDGTTTLEGTTNIGNQITDTLIVSASNVDFPSVVEKSSVATTDNILILEGDRVKQTPQSGLPYVITLDDGGGAAPDKRIAMFTGSEGKTIVDVPGVFHNSGTGLNISNSGTVFDLTAGKTFMTNLTLTGNITASGNISSSGQILTEAGPTINTTLASDSATNIDTFNTSSNNGAIYDYTLFSAPSGARAGQCMVIHHNGNTDFTDTSTPTLGSEISIPFFETAVNGANVEVKITSGSGYTFKAFVKKL